VDSREIGAMIGLIYCSLSFDIEIAIWASQSNRPQSELCATCITEQQLDRNIRRSRRHQICNPRHASVVGRADVERDRRKVKQKGTRTRLNNATAVWVKPGRGNRFSCEGFRR